MIELKLTTGEERLLIPVRNSNGQYELVDNTNTVQMVVVLKNTHIEVIDKCNIDIDAYNKEDLSSRLDLLAVEIIENEQSGIEHNEYEDRIEVKFKCKHIWLSNKSLLNTCMLLLRVIRQMWLYVLMI